MERRGFEPLTPTLPVSCATNCANAPRLYYLVVNKAFGSAQDFRLGYLSENVTLSHLFLGRVNCANAPRLYYLVVNKAFGSAQDFRLGYLSENVTLSHLFLGRVNCANAPNFKYKL